MNKITPKDVPHENSFFYKASVVYLCEDGTETIDPTKATLDRFGQPYLLRRVASSELLDICVSPPSKASLSPSDPVSRSSVLSSVNDFSSKSSFPQIYMDKFRVATYADNSVNAFVNNLSETLKNSEL